MLVRHASVAAMACVVMTLAACGGGGGVAPAPTLTLSSGAPGGQPVEGGAPVTLSLAGTTAASGTVTWTLSPSIGSISGASATGALYTPPALGGLTAPTLVTITATPTNGSAAALPLTITLVPFSVLATSPAAGDSVGVGVAPTIQFTRAVAPSTSASSVSFASPVASVPVDVAASGATLTLSPKRGLVWGGHYTVSLSSGVASSVGQALAPVAYSFDVAPPSWSAPAQLAVSPLTTGTPVVAFDSSAHALAVWMQDTDGSGTWNIQAARFDLAGRTWSVPVALHAGPHAQASPVLATDAAGNAIAAWAEDAGNFLVNIFASRFVAAQGSWTPATSIQTVSGQTGQAPQVVLDSSGNGTVVWQQYTGVGISSAVYAARFDATRATWSPAVQLDTGTGANNPQVAVDASGNVIAAWEQASPGAVAQIAVARRSQSTGLWGAAQVVQTSTLRGSNPQLDLAADGRGTVVWTQAEANGTLTVQASRSTTAGDGWGLPQALSPGVGVNGGNWPQVRSDPGGNVIVLWQQYQGNNVYSMDAARYDANSARWSSPVHIATLMPASFTNPFSWAPTLVVDAAGNATATWTHDVGGAIFNAFHARFDSHLGTWSAPGALAGSVGVPDRVYTTVDGHGNVVATWGVRDVFAFQTPWWVVLAGQ